MTGRFEALIWTDCREGQGLRGTPGLQFQARSAGADRNAEAVVQRNLLYEPPPRWMGQRRPVSDYPASFAHVWDGLLATAAGVYLGRESVGGREGNQLTHAIVTDDPAAYGLVRPAQMFGAPFWTAEPARTTQCPALLPGWHPGSFGAAEAQTFVRGAPDGDELLGALLSTLRPPSGQLGRRVLFVAREAAEVMRWITAVTLLIPQREALRIGFKVFTLNPAFAPHRILAVHPDWGGAEATLDNDQGYAVFDLVRHDWSRVTHTRAARQWTELFLAEDPMDVVDAVEVAAASGLDDDGGTTVALAAILGRRPPPEKAAGLVGWLRQGPPQLVRRYGSGIVDLLVAASSQWPVEVLRSLDEVSRATTSWHRAAQVRLALIEAELREATVAGVVRPERAPPLSGEWTPAEHERLLAAIIREMRLAEPPMFETLLRLCGRFGLRPPLADLQPGLDRFVLDWADNPDHAYQVASWACAEEIQRLLRHELGERLAHEPDRAYDLGDSWWDVLLREPMRLDEPLDAAVVEAALRHLPARQQLDLVEQCLRTALAATRPVAMVNRTASVIWTHRAVSRAEAHLLAHLLPRDTPLDSRVFALLHQEVIDYRSKREYIDAALVVIAHGLWVPQVDTLHAITGHRALAYVFDQLADPTFDGSALLRALDDVPPHLAWAQMPDLCEAITRAPVVAVALTVLTHVHVQQLTEPCSRKLCGELMNNSNPAHVALAFVLLNIGSQSAVMASMIQPGVRADLDRQVRTVVSRCSEKRFREITTHIDGLGPMWSALWKTFARSHRRGLVRRLRQRRRG
ncbi:GTPase-associated protein 1-related protein [Micromonospora sp. NBC_00860]|uniref:GTPase-associated protein 1-related protein n=1 Tax=Micromonospora sp. NBC_00860 TaxID=2975980 RepID=UPI003868FBFF|nr:GTPase-associated protein 1-related protein [Micromonospora sp. NBC_00860]